MRMPFVNVKHCVSVSHHVFVTCGLKTWTLLAMVNFTGHMEMTLVNVTSQRTKRTQCLSG